MKFFICPNLRTEKHVTLADGVVERFRELGAECSMEEERCLRMYGNTRFARFSPEEADLIVAIGGDGSVLRAAKLAVKLGKPLLGVNSGRLGFLCALDAMETEKWTPEFLKNLTPAKRKLLSFTLGEKEYFSLNDVVIAKENFGESMESEVSFCEEKHRFCGDGVIVATPTGSTAYNMSAGGALLHPDVSALVVTPICPHDGRIRSKVIPSEAVVWITLLRSPGGKAQVYSDGELCGTITDSLHVQIANKTLTIYTK